MDLGRRRRREQRKQRNLLLALRETPRRYGRASTHGAGQHRRSMPRSRTDWIVVDAAKGGALACRRCGEEYLPRFPLSANVFVGLVEGFTKDHAGCLERLPPPGLTSAP